MHTIESHPVDLSQPYNEVKKEVEWIVEDTDIHIFRHVTTDGIYVWFTEGYGIHFEEVEFLFLTRAFNMI